MKVFGNIGHGTTFYNWCISRYSQSFGRLRRLGGDYLEVSDFSVWPAVAWQCLSHSAFCKSFREDW